MPIKFVNGDLFSGDYDAIGHGVNLAGVMGAGIAKEFRKRYPDMFLRYRIACVDEEFQLGDVMGYLDEESGIIIYNLATQIKPGPNASLAAVSAAVTLMLGDAKDYGLSEVAIPRIGCGIGGLNWNDVRYVLTELAEESPVTLTVVSL